MEFEDFYEEMFEGPKNEGSFGTTIVMNLLANCIPAKAYEWCRVGLNCFSVAMGFTHEENHGLFTEEVRSVYKCDALQHLEMLVDLLDTKHDAVCSYAYAGLSCGCMIGMFLGEIACHLCDEHGQFYQQEDGTLTDMMADFISVNREHVENGPDLLHSWHNVVTDKIVTPDQIKHDDVAKKLLGELND